MDSLPITNMIPRKRLTAAAAINTEVVPIKLVPGKRTKVLIIVDGSTADDHASVAVVLEPLKSLYQGGNALKNLHEYGIPVWPKGYFEWTFEWSKESPLVYIFYARENGASGDLTLYVQEWHEALPASKGGA